MSSAKQTPPQVVQAKAPQKKAPAIVPIPPVDTTEDDSGFDDDDVEQADSPVGVDFAKIQAHQAALKVTANIFDTERPVDWNEALDALTVGNGTIFPKEGQTRVRLIWSPQDPKPWVEVETSFKGVKKSKFLVLAYKIPTAKAPTNGEAAPAASPPKIQGLLLPKTVWRAIAQLGQDPVDPTEFFHPKKGYGITITQTRTSGKVDYSVATSKRVIPLPATPEFIEQYSTITLTEAANEYQAFQASRANRSEDGAEDPEPTSW